MDALFQEFLKEAGLSVDQVESPGQVAESYKSLFAEAEHLKAEIGGLEEEREVLRKKTGEGRRPVQQIAERRGSRGDSNSAE